MLVALLLASPAWMETIRLAIVWALKKAKVKIPNPTIMATNCCIQSRDKPIHMRSSEACNRTSGRYRSDKVPVTIEPATPVMYIIKIMATH